jgi:HEAT repeat protein
MASSIGKIYKLLSGNNMEQRIAAAIVLGELSPKETQAVKLLNDAASDQDLTLRSKAIEALGKIASPPARQVLYPYLEEDGEIRAVAIRAVARTGNPAVSHVKRTFAEASLASKRTYLHVLASIQTPEAMTLVLDILRREHPSIARDAVEIFRHETGALESKVSRSLSAQIRKELQNKEFLRNRTAVEAAVLMLNHLRDPGSAKILLQFAEPGHQPSLRRCSLLGLRWVLPDYKERDKAVRALLGYLEEDDFQNIVSPALEALQPLEVTGKAADLLIELADSRHPLVRKFSLTKMSGLSQVKATRTLVGALADPDPMIRELASRSLQTQRGAWKVVVEALRTCSDVDLAWRMVHAVKGEGARVPADALREVAKEAIERLENNDPIAEPMLDLVQTLAPDVHFEALFKRAMHWKRKGKFGEAELALRPLTRNETCTDDARFELAVMSLKTSTATAGAIARDSDLALSLVKGLLRNTEFPLLKRLNSEKKVLEHGDYYYLGFHLVEGSTEEREIGAEILHRLVTDSPRSKVGRSAKSKLRIEGLL